ncbi:MAG: helix-turn-helix domain-containing protein [Candidatus Magasanikbacteria bacterium]|nr:helix-turn-helix domain-containing protein [Candidatus Magasanikbacteria bacterium]
MAKNVDIKNEKYQNAIRLKYSDFTYSEIAQLLKVSHVTVKRWFRSDGLLKDEYERYEKERNKVRNKETDTILMKHAEVASKMLVSLMGAKSDAMKFRAAKTILDFVRGPAGSRDDDCNDEEYKRSSRQIAEILEKYKNKKTVGN